MSRISRIHFHELYDAFQPLQCPYNDCAVCPRADMVEVKDVSAPLGREPLGGYRVAKSGRHPVPLAFTIDRVAVE